MTLPLGLLIPLFLGMGSWLKHIWDASWDKKLNAAVRYAVGYRMDERKFALQDAHLALGAGTGIAISYGLGTVAGINKRLGRAHVPLVRL